MGPRWDSPELQVASDNARTAKYRLLQSWYREQVLGARPGTYRPRGRPERPLGSLLHRDDLGEPPARNFLDPKVYDYAVARAAEVQAEQGTLEEDRLMRNMLSSMPLCFNLFGFVRETPDARLEFVQRVFDERATSVDMIECEWVPDPSRASIGDRTAFDAAIVTTRADGSTHLIAIETKYTEPFSQTRYGDRDRDRGKYDTHHEASGWFKPGTTRSLTAPATNQLWRNCVLAAAAEVGGVVDSAEVAVVALADDPGATKAINGVTAAMTDPSRCRAVPLERIVSEATGIEPLAEWAAEFARRYLDLNSV